METIPQERWQLTDSGAQHYERYTVAQLFEPLGPAIQHHPLVLRERQLEIIVRGRIGRAVATRP